MASASLTGRSSMIASTRGLKTGDLVAVPAGIERREVVVESVALDGLRFTDTRGAGHDVGDAERVPLPGTVHPNGTPDVTAHRGLVVTSRAGAAR